MMEITPSSAAAAAARMHALIAIRHGATGGVSEPLDCSSSILDLCIRRQSRTPSPRGKHHHITADVRHRETFAEDPTSTVGVSVSSTSPGSETSETSISSDLYRDLHAQPMQGTLTTKIKVPRPFKAYPKDPLSLTTGVTAAECVLGKDSAEAYSEFRKRMLAQVQATHGITNKNMRRMSQGNNNNNNREDPGYWEKRRKNNEAAKRSRDARRAKEDEIAIRAAFLEQENLKLRYEVAALRNELEKLRNMLYNHPLV